VKQLLKREAVQRVVSWLIAFYIRTVFRLTRWTRVNDGELRARGSSGTPLIACFWHGRLLMMPNYWPYAMRLYLLGSPHRDGQLILRTLRRFGVHSITGSSSRHGARALRQMARVIAEGSSVCIAPDGPRGPLMRVQEGIIALARLSGAPIFPVAYSVEKGRILGSWDRFLLARPFGRGVFIVGEPLRVARDADPAALAAARLELEARLNAVTAEADRSCGRLPVEPAAAQAGTEQAA